MSYQFSNEPPPPYTPYQTNQQFPNPGYGQPGPGYPPASAPYEPYGGPQGPLPQQGGFFPGQQGPPPPPPGVYVQENPKNEGPMAGCLDTCCCCLAGYCACKMITDLLCCICGLLGDD